MRFLKGKMLKTGYKKTPESNKNHLVKFRSERKVNKNHLSQIQVILADLDLKGGIINNTPVVVAVQTPPTQAKVPLLEAKS